VDPLAIVVGTDGFLKEISGVPETFETAAGPFCSQCRRHRVLGREVFLRHFSQRVPVEFTDGKDSFQAEKKMTIFKSVNGNRFMLLGRPNSVFGNLEQCTVAFRNHFSAILEAAARAERAQKEFFARPVAAAHPFIR